MGQYYLSFDVGLANLAFTLCELDDSLTYCTVVDARCVNTMIYTHESVTEDECLLHHTKEAYDRIMHFIQEYAHIWESKKPLKRVFIERQPICGLNHVESILFSEFREIAVKISPNAMHTWLKINHLDYDGRKVETVRLARIYLEDLDGFNIKRQHDMADALMILFYGVHLEKISTDKEALLKSQRKSFKRKVGVSMDEYFNNFKYTTLPDKNRPTKKLKIKKDNYLDTFKYKS